MTGRFLPWLAQALPRKRPPDAVAPDVVGPGALPLEGIAGGPAAGYPFLDRTFRALRNRNYRLFYFGQTISLSGTWMQAIAQSWLVLQITGSKVALGTVTMLQFLPITLFVLFAGVIADRVPKRNFIIGTMTLAMAQALTLAALVWSGHIQLWHVYVLAVVLGLANAFEQPTRQAFVIEMVGREDLMNAVALNSGMFNAARLIGPAIGGVIITAVGVKVAFLINGLSFIPVIVGLLMMDMTQLHTRNSARRAGVSPLAELREGLAYAFHTPAILLIVILVAFVGTFGYNFTVALPLVDRFLLGRGATELGFLTASVGLGALVSALALAGRRSATKQTLFLGGLAFAGMLGAVAVSHSLYATLVFLLMLGLASTAFGATANTSMQLATPDHLRGRVMGLYMLLFAGSTPIGGYLTGQLAQHLGVSTALGIEAALCVLGMGIGVMYYVTHRQAVTATERAAAPP
ncbi:MAG TPA: MFS transporter [Dehalococcoidia bacterium]|nr:MFS transporter [Dehalococcoidia bacterium]